MVILGLIIEILREIAIIWIQIMVILCLVADALVVIV
jgi:hypothetical protein